MDSNVTSSIPCPASIAPLLVSWNGPLILGYMLSYALFGVLSLQVFIYHTRFPGDRPRLKAFVGLLFLLECILSAFVGHAAWTGAVSTSCSYLSSAAYVWSIRALPGLSGIIASVVHGFFSWRIWALGMSMKWPVVIMILSISQCAFSIFTGIGYSVGEGVTYVPPASDISQTNPVIPIYIWLGGSVLCDILITVKVVMLLIREKRISKLRRTNSLLTRLIALTVETGMVTSLVGLLQLFSFVGLPSTNLNLLWLLILSKIYANSAMATLNARLVMSPQGVHSTRSAVLWDNDDDDSLPSTQTESIKFASRNIESGHELGGVHVISTLEVHSEDDGGMIGQDGPKISDKGGP